jgi:VanZ family protein
MITRLARAMAWLYAVALVFLTLGPPGVRLETAMPHDLEHMAAFGISGLLFSIGYGSGGPLVLLAGVGLTVVLETLQIGAPGRHARWIDLAMNASGFCIGVGVALVVSRSVSHLLKRRRRDVGIDSADRSTAAQHSPDLPTSHAPRYEASQEKRAPRNVERDPNGGGR